MKKQFQLTQVSISFFLYFALEWITCFGALTESADRSELPHVTVSPRSSPSRSSGPMARRGVLARLFTGAGRRFKNRGRSTGCFSFWRLGEGFFRVFDVPAAGHTKFLLDECSLFKCIQSSLFSFSCFVRIVLVIFIVLLKVKNSGLR